ncbi:TonB-dependent receptor [Psychrosphaera saromensis]|uniref:TonB-dependent receptor n=1 Tax=Psychrosphaera saromensis TaxID=716813 RepID=A0A2S7UVT2_9GAMM|nr:TonB-dependent receptor [Psychrosphaera saromensis]PQJ54057.1 TonB-dependent receptor [Psychrosphaera saromensis]GHB76491.1 TonB-dependent receptor [Psychrosphaera saromensis]GLQ14446.1 TonB-dependent receptor [Psychrosphaera saromensis]
MTSSKSTFRPLTKLTKLSLAILCATTVNSYADETAAKELEEVVVVAQKRAQSIQDVPVTISAYDGDFLESLGIGELDALSDITPGLVIQEQSPNNPGFVIRGITSDSGSSQSSPRVSIYYNGVDVSRSRGSYFELFDVEGIEVVKGPQATLFGTAASVGAISVATRKPEQDFSAQIKASVGNFAANNVSGFVTGGSDLVQGRVAFTYRARDGFIENIAGDSNSQSAGGFVQEDMHALEHVSYRPSLRITPNNDVTIDLVYTYEKNDDSGTSFKNGLYAPTGGDTSPYSFVEMSGSPLSEQVFGKEDLGVDRTVNDINLTANWNVNDNLTVTSITAQRSFDSLEVFDADGTQAWFLEFAEEAEGDQFSQELRAVYTQDKLTSIFGASYFSEDGSQAVPFSTEESIFLNCLGVLNSGVPCINSDGSVNVLTPVLTGGLASVLPYSLEFTNFGENTAYSAFADVSYKVTDALELTAGLRYVKEEKRSGYKSDAPNSVLTQAPLFTVDTAGETFYAEADYDDWLPRFNALYEINSATNVYATISKGRRSEVLEVSSTTNTQGAPAISVTEVPSELIWNYETGIKGKALQSTLDYSLAVFYQNYSNFQVSLQDEDGVAYSADAGSATNLGLEAEVRALLSDEFEVFANAAYLDAEIDDDSNNGQLAGNTFRLQPEWTFSTGLFYGTEISSSLNLTSSLIYSYRTDVFFEPENAPISGLDISQEGFGLMSARLGIASSANWSVSLFANNLLDEEYLVDAGNTGGGFGNPTFVAGAPRMFGLEFSMDFGGSNF